LRFRTIVASPKIRRAFDLAVIRGTPDLEKALSVPIRGFIRFVPVTTFEPAG
jgi:hypothetical protein